MNTPLQQAAQELVDRIADLGASPLDWPEYTALEKALEAEQAQSQNERIISDANESREGFYKSMFAVIHSEQSQATHITPLMEQQMFDDWCPYKGNPDPRTVWAAAIDAANGLTLGATAYPEQAKAVEPVAWMSTDCIGERTLLFTKPAWEPIPDKIEPLYTHPAPPAGEQAQAVEPARYIWSQCFDLDNGRGWVEVCKNYDPRLPDYRELHDSVDWSNTAQVRDFTVLYTHSAPPVATTRPLAPSDKSEFVAVGVTGKYVRVRAFNDRPAPPPAGERRTMIAVLRGFGIEILGKAADMLEADVQLFKQLTDAVDANARLLEALKRSHNLILHIEDVLPDESLDLIDVTCWNAATSDMHTGAQQVATPYDPQAMDVIGRKA